MKLKVFSTKSRFAFLSFVFGSLILGSCNKDKNPIPIGNEGPTELTCEYFETEDRILKDNPEAPVDYVVTCNMRVSKEITIEPGVVIEFKDNTGLTIEANGSLSAIGTAEKPIIFRGTKNLMGFWYGLYFESSNSLKNELKYVEVSDAGGREYPNKTQGGVMVYAGAKLKMSYSKLNNNEGFAFNARNADFDATNIQNNLFADSKYPVYINTDNLHNFRNN